MAVSVILEIAAFSVAGGAVQAIAHGADQSTVVGIDAVVNLLNLNIIGVIGGTAFAEGGSFYHVS